MSMDKGRIDKGGGSTEPNDIYYFKVENGELFTISPDHVYRDDLTQKVDLDNEIIVLDSETFKIKGTT